MTELLTQNLTIIAQRWPTLATAIEQQAIDQIDADLVTGLTQTISINSIQLSSRHNRTAEAELFINTLPKDTKNVVVYGIGMGDVPHLLIDNPQYQTIEIYILNLSIFTLLLTYSDQTQWLAHPKVTLSAEPQHQLRAPFIAITPELSLISDENALIRDLLVIALNSQYVKKNHQVDDPKLLQRFKDNQRYIEQDPDAAELIPALKSDHIIVIAAGPSLEEHYSALQQIISNPNRPTIIAVDTALRGLLHHGIKPDAVVSIDGNIGLHHLPTANSQDIRLIYFPRVNPTVLGAWKGQRYTAYSQGELYNNLAKVTPKLRLYTGGSVVHPAIDFAVKLRPKTISLLGCDFCYCKNKSHAFWSEYKFDANATNEQAWVNTLKQQVKLAKHWVIDGHGQKVGTDLNFRAYLRYLEQYISHHPEITFYNTSLSGAKIQGTQYKELTSWA